MFQYFAYSAVSSQQVGCRYSFTIRRVCHHYSLFSRLLKVLYVSLFYCYAFCHAGSLDVEARLCNGCKVDVIAIYVVSKFALIRVVVVNLVEEVAVKVGPFLEGIFLSEQTGSHVVGYQGSLYGQGSRSAHRVNKVCFASPAGHKNHSGSENLIERSLDRLLSVSSSVKTFTTRVERQRTLVFGDVHVQANVRVGH